MIRTHKLWDYNSCYEEAKKHTSRASLKKSYPSCYTAARKHGWLDDYVWFERKRRKNWDADSCKSEALNFKTLYDFSKYSPSAYHAAKVNGWLKDYTWLKVSEKHPRDYWDEYRCLEAALSCTSLKQYREEFGSSYNSAKKHGWLEDYSWLERKYKKPGFWDFNHCRDISMLFTSRSEFQKGCKTAYNISRKNGWLDDFTWLVDKRFDLFKDKVDSVYSYEFKEQHAVYVGRTLMRLQERRDYQHIVCKDAVSKFAKENNVSVPKMKILEDKLTLKEGSKKEGFWLEKYKSDGWIILNKTKTGGIGGLGKNKSKYTYEVCYEIAKSCKNITEMRKITHNGYEVARKNNWVKDYTWFEEKVKPKDYWNKERCFEAASSFLSRKSFSDAFPTAYAKAVKNGWIENYTWFKTKEQMYSESKRIWYPENTRDEALKYSTLKDFATQNNAAYEAACKYGWISEYTWLERHEKGMERTYTEDKCKEIALNYDTIIELRREHPNVYYACIKYGYLEKFTWLKRQRQKHGYWTESLIFEISRKYETFAEFNRKDNAAYCAARRMGILEKMNWLKRLR